MPNSVFIDRTIKFIEEKVKKSSMPNADPEIDSLQKAAVDLAAILLKEANSIQTKEERTFQTEVASMMEDSKNKVFTTSIIDQCFRSDRHTRVADQLIYLLNRYGIPGYFSYLQKLQLWAFKNLGKSISGLLVPLIKKELRKKTAAVILPGEEEALLQHMKMRRMQGVRINLNHLGEAILGENEAKNRLEMYIEDLKKEEIEYISIKISTIYSQINLLAWEQSLEVLAERLKKLYRTAKEHRFAKSKNHSTPKFVNLDMEEYRDLQLTVELFCKVLNEPEFFNFSAGIVLQAYLPDSYLIQQKLTVWAMERLAKGGAPIKIRIVKGANLGMEQVEASLRGWQQAPYSSKLEADANFKRMVEYALTPEHAEAARVGIGSHNLFDIAYALLLVRKNGVEDFVCFEMLEGMADQIRRVVQPFTNEILLYCPTAKAEDFQNAIAYLVRRLDENTAPENFLRYLFGLQPGSEIWKEQSRLFLKSFQMKKNLFFAPRRQQNRLIEPIVPDILAPFENEPDTDWSLENNRKWANGIFAKWKEREIPLIPLVIGEGSIAEGSTAVGEDPSKPGKAAYKYILADLNQAEKALSTAKEAEKSWQRVGVAERSEILHRVAHEMRKRRQDLIGAMVMDTGKSIADADVEISEAIDFAEYYRRKAQELHETKGIAWRPKGTVLVAPPWNFPCSIPAGGILASLAAGNCVIFKPAPEAVLTGWELAKLFWDAGLSRHVLQFLICEDDPVGSFLVKDPRINSIVLTGATATAKAFLKMRPEADLIAETGGKNAIIISNMADRDLAIKDIIQSAFGYAGQKCSACSLAICHAEIYDNLRFRQQLCDAAASLAAGSAWDLATKLNPLIRGANPTLLRGLTELDEGEEWLLQPKQDPKNPNLWSPGIKIGVKKGSFTHQNEFFGPVLALMRAETIQEAIDLANGTPYGLTSGIHTLDEREQKEWMEKIEAGNCYINRGITGAIVHRQPFGGTKESSFGRGAKAGGPNYLIQLMHAKEIALPQEQEALPENLRAFSANVEPLLATLEEKAIWNSSLGSYSYAWNNYFKKDQELSFLRGQDNFLRYLPYKKMIIRLCEKDSLIDSARVLAAAITCNLAIEFSMPKLPEQLSFLTKIVKVVEEEDEQLVDRLRLEKQIPKVRFLSPPRIELRKALLELGCRLADLPVLSHGRLELLNYLREVSFSVDYHRYGNLGEREGEKR